MNTIRLILILIAASFSTTYAQHILIEAESFEDHGGWKLDTQSIEAMGSPYMLAHGLGEPVEDASTRVIFPQTGEYRVFVRTKDWVARWEAESTPGKFQLLINGNPVEQTFGTQYKDWTWQDGGTVFITQTQSRIALNDLTGFEGRCDAIFFTKGDKPPPNESEILSDWRRKQLGLKKKPTNVGEYDLVVVGGGYPGMGAALSAARMGCKVALIQNRPVLGGNGSSEVRVWSQGKIRRGKYPRLGEIIDEFQDHSTKSPGTYEEFGDAQKEALVRLEDNIDLFLNHHAYDVDMKGQRIAAVYAFNTRTSERKRFEATIFSDCSGHGTLGVLAGADWEMTEKGRMGMSNMWAWDNAKEERTYPETPWALDLEMNDFPYPHNFHGPWFWESGYDKDPLNDAEGIRDHNLRAVYGAFNAMKNRGGAEKHKNAYLTWVAYIGGPRESRRLMGDIVLTEQDIIDKRQFPDGCVPSTWSIDLHYPKKQYAKKFPDNPFISYAVHGTGVDRAYGYPVPYRTFYSRNIDNLFMAGRNISVTHEALGTVRVMKTLGMIGEVVGKATSICIQQKCSPRDVYKDHWAELDKLMQLPGKARRATLDSLIVIPDDAYELAEPVQPTIMLSSKNMKGILIDDVDAKKTGNWTAGTGLKQYFDKGYLYAAHDSNSTIRFEFQIPKNGRYDFRIAYQSHENRGDKVNVILKAHDQEKNFKVNMQRRPPMQYALYPLTKLSLEKGQRGYIELNTEGAGGYVHADAVHILRID